MMSNGKHVDLIKLRTISGSHLFFFLIDRNSFPDPELPCNEREMVNHKQQASFKHSDSNNPDVTRIASSPPGHAASKLYSTKSHLMVVSATI